MSKKKTKEITLSINAQQEHFVELLAQGYTQAAACNEMTISKEVAQVWLAKPEIKNAIRIRSQELMAQFGNGKEAVLEIAKTIMFADVTDMYEDNGDMKPFDQIPEALRRCINQIKFRKTEDKFGNPILNTEVTMIDKAKALEMISRYLGLFDQSDKGQTDFRIGFE
jgi:hypothetical protein